ncbi:predicted protein [Aspergillus terreus NIH2624]|uniref:Amine oxidase domain-containing protein n=1 Tax=Aspergillus terreus (strain NIH 2624 / FGSC A1156) TaxID=341663 RepID=Q0CL58_ASPTN|nr:uncharacterized protein ATEG_05576 [Aspergillus terreus NIH2624]EAU34645.1 predicted protein [Aspergillus terreus NIH2624]
MSRHKPPRKTVAVVGSGLAGLTTAYLLARDSKERYDVEVFEMQDRLSLDSASYTPAEQSATPTQSRVDLPMRAFAGGYYNNLKLMYEYLGLKFASPKFIYPVSALPEDGSATPTTYYIHSSNNHRFPPLRPDTYRLGAWIWELCYLAACYFWFTACCFLIAPKTHDQSGEVESLAEYIERIHLPRYYTKKYLLPLMSSVTTCPHDALLRFPATDILGYEKRTYGQPHFTVAGGVRQVEEKLSAGIKTRFGAKVTNVTTVGNKAHISWTDVHSRQTHEDVFDYAILAVTPDVVGAIFQPLRQAMMSVPTVSVETVVHYDTSRILQSSKHVWKNMDSDNRFFRTTAHAQPMHICSSSSATESSHEHPSSAIVTTGPVAPIDPAKIVHRVRLVRVLRTTKSRKLINHIFDAMPSARIQDEKMPQWRSGDGNVFLVGGWCWDGMVLLEGCIVSAMRVAEQLGVDVPWVVPR